MIFAALLALIITYQSYELPAEPIIIITAPGDERLELEPSNPRPIVGRFVIACHNGSFICADNGAEFHKCAKWELADLGLSNPKFSNGKCVADRKDSYEHK